MTSQSHLGVPCRGSECDDGTGPHPGVPVSTRGPVNLIRGINGALGSVPTRTGGRWVKSLKFTFTHGLDIGHLFHSQLPRKSFDD